MCACAQHEHTQLLLLLLHSFRSPDTLMRSHDPERSARGAAQASMSKVRGGVPPPRWRVQQNVRHVLVSFLSACRCAGPATHRQAFVTHTCDWHTQ